MKDRNRTILWVLAVIAAWVLVALVWTPPTFLLQQTTFGARSRLSLFHVFAYVLTSFVPWMAVTPLLLRLGRRIPITDRDIVRPLAWHALIGLVTVPLITLSGTLLSVAVMQWGRGFPADLPNIVSAAAITSFYAVPTYIAVAAIAQAVGYFERYRVRERLLARAQLQALQAQINPHFLFNTLNAISALGYRDPARADAALSQLSELIRLALAERDQEIALKDEIAFVRGYLDLYVLLMPEKLKVEFAVEGDAWNARVPAMLLQPLIENAIVHGAARCAEGGRIALSAHIANGRLELSIVNDAPAGSPGTKGGGIGLANVRERLRALYGDRQSLALEREGERVKVSVVLPYRAGAEAE